MRGQERRYSAKPRRKVGKSKESGVNFLDEGAIGLRFGLDADPFGISAERFPVGVCGFAARVDQHVDESLALQRIVGGQPVSHILDAVLFEELHSVVTEAAEEVFELALVDVIGAKFVTAGAPGAPLDSLSAEARDETPRRAAGRGTAAESDWSKVRRFMRGL